MIECWKRACEELFRKNLKTHMYLQWSHLVICIPFWTMRVVQSWHPVIIFFLFQAISHHSGQGRAVLILCAHHQREWTEMLICLHREMLNGPSLSKVTLHYWTLYLKLPTYIHLHLYKFPMLSLILAVLWHYIYSKTYLICSVMHYLSHICVEWMPCLNPVMNHSHFPLWFQFPMNWGM